MLLLLFFIFGLQSYSNSQAPSDPTTNLKNLTKEEILDKLLSGMNKPSAPSIKNAKLNARDLLQAAYTARVQRDVKVDLAIKESKITGTLNLCALGEFQKVSKREAKYINELQAGEQIIYIPHSIRIEESTLSSVTCDPAGGRALYELPNDPEWKKRPVLFKGDLQFDESVFEGQVDFSNIIVGGSNLSFVGAKFKNYAIFDDAIYLKYGFDVSQFSEEVFCPGERGFSGATFSKKVSFVNVVFDSCGIQFLNTVFGWGNSNTGLKLGETLADFSHASFKTRPLFLGAKFNHGASFSQVTFKRGVHFGLPGKNPAVFKGDVLFKSAKFNKDADFYKVEFRKVSYKKPSRSKFRTYVNFDNASFKGEANFARAKFFVGSNLDWLDDSNFEGRLNLIRTSFSSAGEAAQVFDLAVGVASKQESFYRGRGEARYYHLRYMRARRSLMEWYNPLRWAERILIDWTSAYGASWIFVLRSWFFVIGLFTIIFRYFHGAVAKYRQPISTITESFYVVVTTFTSLGNADYEPKDGFFKVLTAILSLSGTFLMALFIWVLARQYFL